MEESADRELEAILKLIKLTQEGTLKWKSAELSGDLHETNTIKYVNVMTCSYAGKELRIFTRKKLKERPSVLDGLISNASIFNTERTYPYWVEADVLEITDKQGQSLWRFAHKSAIDDLLNAAKYQVSGIKDFLGDILSK